MLKKKKLVLALLFILFSLVIVLFLVGWYQVYRTSNAFYFSYKNHESLTKQTDAFVSEVTTSDMKRIGVKSSSFNNAPFPSNNLAAYIEYGGYVFMPHNSSAFGYPLGVGFRNSDSSFYYSPGFRKIIGSGFDDNSKEEKTYYTKNSLREYKQLLKKTYDHWQFRYKFPFVND